MADAHASLPLYDPQLALLAKVPPEGTNGCTRSSWTAIGSDAASSTAGPHSFLAALRTEPGRSPQSLRAPSDCARRRLSSMVRSRLSRPTVVPRFTRCTGLDDRLLRLRPAPPRRRRPDIHAYRGAEGSFARVPWRSSAGAVQICGSRRGWRRAVFWRGLPASPRRIISKAAGVLYRLAPAMPPGRR
jgi:hypothetical protein